MLVRDKKSIIDMAIRRLHYKELFIPIDLLVRLSAKRLAKMQDDETLKAVFKKCPMSMRQFVSTIDWSSLQRSNLTAAEQAVEDIMEDDEIPSLEDESSEASLKLKLASPMIHAVINRHQKQAVVDALRSLGAPI